MNPSAEDLLKAVENAAAPAIVVLPNNKNIIMAAEQTIALCDKKIVVIPTKTIPQGICALMNFNPDMEEADNSAAMTASLSAVHTAQITFAARDSEFEDKKIKKDQILGLCENKVSFIDDKVDGVIDDIGDWLGGTDSTYVTLFYGEDIGEQDAQAACDRLSAKLGEGCEVSIIPGGQPIYYYIISAE